MTKEKQETTEGMENIAPGFPDETEIVQRVHQGDRDALIKLYETYIDPVYRHVYTKVSNTADAEDLTSETFMRAIEAIMSGHYAWRGQSFGDWLFAITRHILQERRRKLNDLPLIEYLEHLPELAEPGNQEMDIPDDQAQKEE